ncbi:MAG: bifunctional diaminohydroxyphosphoribosylaminopyrimidine deaminase/5-amino-6-(5-phosphoribosylamino)uracil reductase RibD [Candidatus Nitrospinota bacterium M3_3B_026]
MGRISSDSDFMLRAVELARKGKGRTSPNPAVGAVIVKDGKVVGEGWHKKAGKPHAEIEALRSARGQAAGAALYVTLEPCNHHGLTPPCTDAIIAAGITRVVIGARDTSPKEGERGAARLRKAGVAVRAGVLKKDCGRLVEDFLKHSRTGLPFVTLKTAMTLDGKIATASGDSKWISSEESRRYVHRLRDETGAVMAGADTVIADNPELTVRHGRGGRDPLRVIVDSRLRTPRDAKVVKRAKRIPTIIATSSAAPLKKVRELERAGVEVLVLPSRSGRVRLSCLMEELGRRGVMGVLLEGAGELAGAAVGAGVVDRVLFFIAPKIAGGTRCPVTGFSVEKMSGALELSGVEVERIGPDVAIGGLLGDKAV